MTVTVHTHVRRRARRPHPRGPVVTVKIRKQDAFYVIGTLIGDEASLEERIRERAKSEDRGLNEDEKMELEEVREINQRINDTIRRGVTRRKA